MDTTGVTLLDAADAGLAPQTSAPVRPLAKSVTTRAPPGLWLAKVALLPWVTRSGFEACFVSYLTPNKFCGCEGNRRKHCREPHG